VGEIMDLDLQKILERDVSAEDTANSLIAYSRSTIIPLNILEDLSTHKTPYMRAAVSICMDNLRGYDIHELRKKMIEDEDSKVKQATILSMGASRDSRSLFCLVNLYNNSQKETREKVLIALKDLRDPRSPEFLEVVISKEEGFLKKLAQEALASTDIHEKFAYSFHGKKEMLELAKKKQAGILITSYGDIAKMDEILQSDVDYHLFKPQTYIVSTEGDFYLGGYDNEHVVTAKGRDVIAAGEASFEKEDGKWKITYLNNRSNGFYPASTCYRFVQESLEGTRISFPSEFSETFPKEGYYSHDFLYSQPFFDSTKKKRKAKRC
jgi:hypothetical protein